MPDAHKGRLEQTDPRSFTILVADDENDLRSAVAFDLKRKGFSVLAAENGEQALKLIRSNKIDLVISDIRMPNGDGLFLLEKIQSLPDKVPLIFITGFSDVTEAECTSRGAIKMLPKPFERTLLMNTVFQILGIEPNKR